jgi:hypothetical protein
VCVSLSVIRCNINPLHLQWVCRQRSDWEQDSIINVLFQKQSTFGYFLPQFRVRKPEMSAHDVTPCCQLRLHLCSLCASCAFRVLFQGGRTVISVVCGRRRRQCCDDRCYNWTAGCSCLARFCCRSKHVARVYCRRATCTGHPAEHVSSCDEALEGELPCRASLWCHY